MKLKKISAHDPKIVSLLSELKRRNAVPDEDISAYFDLLIDDWDTIIPLLSFFVAYYEPHEDLAFHDEQVEQLEFNVRQKTKEKIINQILKDNYQINRIMDDLSEISHYVNDIDEQERKYYRNNRREKNNLISSFEMLENALHKEEIINAREIIKGVHFDDIRYAILELIYEHNMKYYHSLEAELSQLNQNSKIQYQAVLHEYGISKEMIDVGSIMQNSVEDVTNILKILDKYNFSKENVIKILQNTDITIVMMIQDYIQKGYLSRNFIYSNIDMFYSDSKKFSIFNDNLEFVNSFGINPYLFHNSIYVLCDESGILKQNLTFMQEYQLLKNLKTADSLDFLLDPLLCTKMDRLIELGYEQFLEEDLSILNQKHLKRLEVLKALNMPIDSKEELNSILSDDKKFFIRDEELDFYIPNVLPYKDKLELSIDDLEEFKGTSRSYQVGNVIVSRPKVLRLQAKGMNLYDAMTFGMKLSEEEYHSMFSNYYDSSAK